MRKPKLQWTAGDKDRWLAELARAIDEAQQIVWRLSVLRGDDPRASQLYGQLESARDEVERLQRAPGRHVSLKLGTLMANVSACVSAGD